MTSMTEKELLKLIQKARKAMEQELDSCMDWINDEMRKSEKTYDQIEKLQRKMVNIDSKLFNESRTVCEELKEYQKRLQEHRKALLGHDQTFVIQTLDELGQVNEGFKRSRKILFTK